MGRPAYDDSLETGDTFLLYSYRAALYATYIKITKNILKYSNPVVYFHMLLYIWYPVLLCVLFWNARIEKKGSWNDGFLSLGQTKALLGFCTLGVVFHHLSQNLAWRTWPITQLGLFFDSGVYWVGLFLFCSGYGVYKSYLTKPGYLHGFVMHRVVKKILIPFYLTTLIYIIVMFAAGMHIGFPDILWYATGVRLANRNAWY